jgi:hypothetical protein
VAYYFGQISVRRTIKARTRSPYQVEPESKGDPMKYDYIVAIVFIWGFAVQQLLQIADPFVSAVVASWKKYAGDKGLPGGLTDAEFKKAIMGLFSFLIGLVVTLAAKISVLKYIDPNLAASTGDTLLTALLIGSGTEGTNTLLKYLGYVKDARKPDAAVELTISPTTQTVPRGASFQFLATVKNSDNAEVTWKVSDPHGGTIISSTGLYTAPSTAGGPFQILATSVADPTKSAMAAVTVS